MRRDLDKLTDSEFVPVADALSASEVAEVVEEALDKDCVIVTPYTRCLDDGGQEVEDATHSL